MSGCHIPVAERHYEVSELKSLTLVYGDDAYAVTASYGYCLAMELAIPIIEEFLDCCDVFLHVFLQTVEESRGIWSLTFELGEAELAVDVLGKLIERH